MLTDCFNNPVQMQQAIAITFDTDWAPDWCIALCFELCIKLNITATFFVTNASPILQKIASNKQFELGIHPNFLVNHNTTKDCTLFYKEILEPYFQIVPTAKSIRSHSLYHNSRLFVYIEEHAPSICNEVSTFLPGHIGLQPIPIQFSPHGRPLLHFSCIWEDDIAIIDPQRWLLPTFNNTFTGVYIFNFHPIHIVLNSCSPKQYSNLRKLHRITDITPQDCNSFINTTKFGVKDYFERLIQSLSSPPPPQTIAAISQNYLKGT